MTGRDRLHSPYAAFVSAGAARAISKSYGVAAQDDTPITLATGLRSLVVERWSEAPRLERARSWMPGQPDNGT
jgi:hypothetical protein